MGTPSSMPNFSMIFEMRSEPKILSRTASYRRDGDRMTLLDATGRPMAAFKKAQP